MTPYGPTAKSQGRQIQLIAAKPRGHKVYVDTLGEGGSQGPSAGAPTDPVLRAKYIDYCSAQLTDVFLSLSDEKIYDLVEEAARAAHLHPGALGFKAMVRLVTQKLRDSVPLPEYEVWCREYEADPERFDVSLLGLWEELLTEGEDGADGQGGS